MTILSALLDRGPAQPDSRSGEAVVKAGRVYLLPTRQGLIYAALLAVMFVGSINYSNNLGYFLTFLLTSMGVTSLVYTHRNMVGLRIRPGASRAVFAGSPARFKILVKAANPPARLAIQVESGKFTTPSKPVFPDSETEFEVEIAATRRGNLSLPRVAISSCYPLGLVRGWAWFDLDSRCLVYPAPAGERRLPAGTGTPRSGKSGTVSEPDNYAGLRDYCAGDSLRRIAWKASARSQGIYTKLFDADEQDVVVLRWQDVIGGDDEARLSQLCLWTLISADDNLEYELVLPGRRLAASRGRAHRTRCLEALARYGE